MARLRETERKVRKLLQNHAIHFTLSDFFMQIVENYTKLRAKEADKAMFYRVNSNQIDAKKKIE